MIQLTLTILDEPSRQCPGPHAICLPGLCGSPTRLELVPVCRCVGLDHNEDCYMRELPF